MHPTATLAYHLSEKIKALPIDDGSSLSVNFDMCPTSGEADRLIEHAKRILKKEGVVLKLKVKTIRVENVFKEKRIFKLK